MPKITFTLPVYTFHIDFIGHVSNIVYVQWMEIGRHKLLEAIGLQEEKIAKSGFLPVLASTQISYIKPLYMGDHVRIDMWLSELRRASACVEFRFFNQEQELVAQGTQKGLFIDTQTQKPHRLTKEHRALFESYLD